MIDCDHVAKGEGIGWMRRDSEAWSKDSFLAIHNWWHLALYHLELGDIGEVRPGVPV